VAELPLDEAIPRLRSNEDRFDQFVNGGTSTSFTTTGSVAVPSIRKFLNDKDAEINVSSTGILAQTTTAKNAAQQAQADAETAAGNAADSEAAAAGSASAAAGSASNASDSELAAQQAKVDAETAAGNASDSELAAQQAKADAETAAGNAADSEAAAAGSASDAAGSAGTALSAKGAAESARDTALAAFANFQDQYLGALPDEPTTDLDGSALDGGELYFNTTNGVMNVYTTDAGWVAAYVSATGIPLIANNGSEYDPATFRTNLSLYSKAQIDAHTNATNNPHSVTKAQVGLGNVDNTADANKPVSTAQAAAIAGLQSQIDDLETAVGSISVTIDPWACFPVGHIEYVRDDLTGVEVPPTDQDYRYVKLTAGLTGAAQYNEGCLTSESVSGSAPLVLASATVSLAGSPMNGQTIRLLNTEGRILRPSTSSGTLQNDALQSHTHTVSYLSGSGSNGLPSTGFSVSGNVTTSDHNGRSANETRMKNVGVTAYMRIK
jgi:hypothetical protein